MTNKITKQLFTIYGRDVYIEFEDGINEYTADLVADKVRELLIHKSISREKIIHILKSSAAYYTPFIRKKIKQLIKEIKTATFC